jgi:hypothetical protein
VFKGEILANMTQVSDVAHGPLVYIILKIADITFNANASRNFTNTIIIVFKKAYASELELTHTAYYHVVL